MTRKFRVNVSGNKQDILSQIKKAGRKQGVTVTGTTEKGKFSGLISGSYTVSGNIVTVSITKKPFIISWDEVEKRLRAGLEG